MSSQASFSWPSYRIRHFFFFCWAGLTSNQKAISYSHNIHASIVSMNLSCHPVIIVADRIHKQIKTFDVYSLNSLHNTFLYYKSVLQRGLKCLLVLKKTRFHSVPSRHIWWSTTACISSPGERWRSNGLDEAWTHTHRHTYRSHITPYPQEQK